MKLNVRPRVIERTKYDHGQKPRCQIGRNVFGETLAWITLGRHEWVVLLRKGNCHWPNPPRWSNDEERLD